MAVYGNLAVVASDNAAYLIGETYPVLISDDGSINIEHPDADGKLSNGQTVADTGTHAPEDLPTSEGYQAPAV